MVLCIILMLFAFFDKTSAQVISESPGSGYILVETQPEECNIYLDGIIQSEVSPLELNDVTLGTYILKVEIPKYSSTTQFEIHLNQELKNVVIKLSAYFGSVELVTDAPEANIIIDNISVAKKTYDGSLTDLNCFVQVSTIEHELYSIQDTIPDVEVGHVEPGQSDVPSSLLRFISTPNKVQISVDGESVGFTPTSVLLASGNRKISMEKKGFQSVTMQHQLMDSEEEVVILMTPLRFRKKSSAIIFSLIWPGGGQSYLNRGSLHMLSGAIGYGMLAGFIMLRQEANNTYDYYLQEFDPAQRQQLKTEWQSSSRSSQTLLIGAGIIWISNIVWTAVMPDELTKYNKLQMNASFDNMQGSAQLGMVYKF